MLRLAVLASGRGSNLGALLAAIKDGRLNSQVVGVFSDRSSAPALEMARQNGIPALSLDPAAYSRRRDFDEALFNEVAAVQPDLIVCAGYMRLISERAVRRCLGKMINIHPSLLPKYPGLHTHARALAAGDAESGASVHLVIPELDAGAVLVQARVPVLAGDDPAALAARILEREHPLLVACIAAIEAGDLELSDAPRWRGQTLDAPLQLSARGDLEKH
jgi:phosphoribosylglycinamide formyltransferase-1